MAYVKYKLKYLLYFKNKYFFFNKMYVTVDNRPYKVYKREGKYYIMKKRQFQKVKKDKIKYGSPPGSVYRKAKEVVGKKSTIKSLLKADREMKKKIKNLTFIASALSSTHCPTDCSEVEKLLQQAKADLKKLQESAGTAIKTENTTKLQQTVNELTRKNSDLEKQAQDLANQLQSSENVNKGMEDEIIRLNAQINSLNTTKPVDKKQLADLQRENASLIHQNDELEKRVESLQKLNDILTSRVNQLQPLSTKLENEVSELSQENDALSTEIGRLKTQVIDLDNQVQNCEKREKELENEITKLKSLKTSDNQQIIQENNTLKTNLESQLLTNRQNVEIIKSLSKENEMLRNENKRLQPTQLSEPKVKESPGLISRIGSLFRGGKEESEEESEEQSQGESEEESQGKSEEQSEEEPEEESKEEPTVPATVPEKEVPGGAATVAEWTTLFEKDNRLSEFNVPKNNKEFNNLILKLIPLASAKAFVNAQNKDLWIAMLKDKNLELPAEVKEVGKGKRKTFKLSKLNKDSEVEDVRKYIRNYISKFRPIDLRGTFEYKYF